jgi:hypothetical protein
MINSKSYGLQNETRQYLRRLYAYGRELAPADVADIDNFVKGLKPVEFVWDERDEKGKHDIKDFGFIAQDLKKSQEDAKLADTLKLVYE